MQCASFVSAQASGFSELIGPPPLAYKKWRFDGQKEITDIASCGEVML